MTHRSPSQSRDGLGLRVGRFAVLHGSQPGSIGLLGALSVGDFFVPALPTQTSVIALGLLQPRRAVWIALTFALAAATGAAILAWLLQGLEGYAAQFGREQFGPQWDEVLARIQRYGAWAVFLGALLPTPPRLLTAACVLSGAPTVAVVSAVFAGKLTWLGVFLALLTQAPRVLSRIPLLGRSIARFKAFQHDTLAARAASPPTGP